MTQMQPTHWCPLPVQQIDTWLNDPVATLRQLAEAHPELNIRFDEPPPPMDPIERAFREYMALICDEHGNTRRASRWRNGEQQIDDQYVTPFSQALTTTLGLAAAIIAKREAQS